MFEPVQVYLDERQGVKLLSISDTILILNVGYKVTDVKIRDGNGTKLADDFNWIQDSSDQTKLILPQVATAVPNCTVLITAALAYTTAGTSQNQQIAGR